MSRVRQAVDRAIDEGFYVVLDVHHDSWQWTSKMSTEHDKVLVRFNTTWKQLATAFRNESAKLVFESINEPQFDNAENKAATLTRLVGDRSYGVNATLQAEFSRGVPWRIQVISHDAPAQSSTTGTAGSFRIPTQFRGDVLATMKAEYADGGNAGPTSWTPYQQFNTFFAPDYAKKEIRLTPAFLDAVKDNARVKLTFHFWSGATVTYHVTKSGSTVSGTTS